MNPEIHTPVVCRLVALHPNVQEVEYWLNKPKSIIGRLASVCDIVVNQPIISRIHAEIEQRGSHYILRNLSRNQTYIGRDAIVGDHVLANGDEIGLARPIPLLRFVDTDPTDLPIELLRYDSRLALFYLNNQPLELPRSLFRLLLHLYRHRGQICTRESCARAIWQEEYLPEYETDNLDRTLSSLRAYIRKAGGEDAIIAIRRGLGYVLEF